MRPEKRPSKRCPIIVLGVERSGTSVVAEMVHRWGAYAGECDKLRQADEHNPQGYWEYKPIWDFLVELGDLAAGVSWWDASFQERVREKLFIPPYRDMALELVAGMAKEGKPWVWKDPALSFFLPFWKEIWGDAVYIITVRNPYETALSWQQFVVPSELEGSVSLIAGNLLRWQYMMLRILEHTEAVERKVFIPYEGFVKEPWKQAKRLCDFLNRNCEVEVSDATRIEAMAEAVNPKLWHHQSRLPFSQVREATDEQKALYQFVERKVEDPLKKFEMAKYPMPPGWLEFVKNEEALIRSGRTPGRMGP
jgi:hypothetical protein